MNYSLFDEFRTIMTWI